jgi:UrcA family protein
MKESKLFKSLVAIFMVIILSGPAVVQAAGTISYIEVGKASVSYADLNLESEESVRVLYRRLKRASKELCSATPPRVAGSVPIFFEINTQETRRCYREALSNAVDKIDNEDLTRIHAG